MLKDDVLKILEENRGKEVSGVFIAQKLGVTRAAVSKAIKRLREEGNGVSSRTNGGYSLSDCSFAMSKIGIESLLKR